MKVSSSSCFLPLLLVPLSSRASAMRSLSAAFQSPKHRLIAKSSPNVLSLVDRKLGFSGDLSSFRNSAAPLRMSSIPEDDDFSSSPFPDIQKSFDWMISSIKSKNVLPPLPEDHIALGGDVLSLFVYSYMDHTVNELSAEAASMDVTDYVAGVANGQSAPSLPVWFDPTQLNEFGHWLVSTTTETPPYAPALASSGLAFVTIATCWIICGYFTGAFLMRNTLECDPSRSLTVTGKTWVCMAVLMIGLALGSDALWGQLDVVQPLSAPARGGLTKADADYIFDSLTVLAWWRLVFNYVLGYRR